MSDSFLHYRIYPRLYRDSVNLMAVAAELEAEPGVIRMGAVMGTPANLEVLDQSGMLPPDWEVQPDDLCIVVRATSSVAAQSALERADSLLLDAPSATENQSIGFEPRTVREASTDTPAQLVAISVPGEFASVVAENALRSGSHVFCFSDNVSPHDENYLKNLAAAHGLLMMGPDCGTALIDGTPLGFVNELPSGPVGVIAASGTGAQELTVLLADAGVGTAQIVGVGGHDLMGGVDSPATYVALEKLLEEPKVQVIAVVSKPPAAKEALRLLETLAESGKPAFACLLGEADSSGPVPVDGTIEGSAARIANYFGKSLIKDFPSIAAPTSPRSLLGWYTGGTLAGEAEVLCQRAGVPAEIIDLGDDQFTRGRPHPMISPDLRAQMIGDLDADDKVLVVDVVLGWGATADPATPVATAVQALRERGQDPLVLASITGTDLDRQGLADQKKILNEAGIAVFPSNASAVRAAINLVEGRDA